MHLVGSLPAWPFSHHVVWELFLGAGIMKQTGSVFPLRKKKVQRCISLQSELRVFWRLLMEELNVALLFLRAFLPSCPTPASSPPSPHSRPLQAGFPGLCQHAEWGGVPRPSWTRCPAAPHSGVGGPFEECPSAADWERSAAWESVWSPACVWSRLCTSVTIFILASTPSSLSSSCFCLCGR